MKTMLLKKISSLIVLGQFVSLQVFANAANGNTALNEVLNMSGAQLMVSDSFPDYTPAQKVIAVVTAHEGAPAFDINYYNEKGSNVATRQFVIEEINQKIRIRKLHGHFVDKKLNEIIRGDLGEPTANKTSVTGLEVGQVIVEGFRGWPANIVAQLGIYQHSDSGLQKDGNAVAGMIKFEWHKFPWSKHVRTKAEIAEGLNYATRVPYEEGLSVREKNDGRDSKLLNYLGVGLGFNLGDILSSKEHENCYIGGYVYHRSGIFGAMSAFNKVNGGSNYQTLYLECDY